MKEFDLEKALVGEPVVLRNSYKAFVKFEVPSEYQTNQCSEIMGFFIDNNNYAKRISWNREGKYNSTFNDDFNIVGMYEEPKPTVTLTLPCPLKDVAIGDEIYILSGYSYQNNGVPEVLVRKHNNSTEFFNAINFGLAFKTKEDAEAWLHALKNSRR